jgi:hypothetical protein
MAESPPPPGEGRDSRAALGIDAKVALVFAVLTAVFGGLGWLGYLSPPKTNLVDVERIVSTSVYLLPAAFSTLCGVAVGLNSALTPGPSRRVAILLLLLFVLMWAAPFVYYGLVPQAPSLFYESRNWP